MRGLLRPFVSRRVSLCATRAAAFR
ncbi:MAG: hypothetical protein JWO95_1400, partial [Verrucomicrobiales bacterium]|nr:hypothetical protein [Verrucomicrobiales bacterium]